MSTSTSFSKNHARWILMATVLGLSICGFATRIGLAQDEKKEAPGTYQFSVTTTPEKKLLQSWLLDTRTGTVYKGRFVEAEGAIVWQHYVDGPVPDDKKGSAGSYQFSVQQNSERNNLDFMLLDTRTGILYTQNETGKHWERYVKAKFTK